MKLREALEIVKTPRSPSAPRALYWLGCSSTPTHLRTFLQAYLFLRRPETEIEIETSTYGDLLGSLESFQPVGYEGAAIICEWYDLDPRLGFRRLGGWGPDLLLDIAHNVRTGLARLRSSVDRISQSIPVTVALPTLPLPPIETCIPAQSSGFEAQIWSSALDFAVWCGARSGLRLLSLAELERQSPPSERFDLRTELSFGFPYTTAHMSALAGMIAQLLYPSSPLKGIITDLDDTLWAGILGEVGVDGVRFTLETQAQIHGLYQQFLQSLSESGVLIAVASKNDQVLAEEGLARKDLLLKRSSIFPVEIHWGPKSESVGRILKAWNIGPESVVFIDDSPLEAAEVRASFPTIRTLVFPSHEPAELLGLFHTLRDCFGKAVIRFEDRIRTQSLQHRVEAETGTEEATSRDDFLSGIGARLSFCLSRDADDERAFELINKTNQFNVNGRRLSEVQLRGLLTPQESFMLTVIYRDKFGPLGKVAVVLGRHVGRQVIVSNWVMSCRAFSRRIEHATLQHIFELFDAEEIVMEFQATERNAPFREFLAEFKSADHSALTRAQFELFCPRLTHAVEEAVAHV